MFKLICYARRSFSKAQCLMAYQQSCCSFAFCMFCFLDMHECTVFVLQRSSTYLYYMYVLSSITQLSHYKTG